MEENRLIAEFIGIKVIEGFNEHSGKKYLYYNNAVMKDYEALPDYKDWGDLMPVVEKIESFTDETNSCIYNVIIEQSFVEIIDCHTSEIIVVTDADTKLEATYKAVVEFINWFNNK